MYPRSLTAHKATRVHSPTAPATPTPRHDPDPGRARAPDPEPRPRSRPRPRDDRAYRQSPVSNATNRFARCATAAAGSSAQSPHNTAISTAAAASTASARAMANDLALSARVTLPAPSAQLSAALLEEREASSRSFASLMWQALTASSSSLATP